ncbi:SCY1-like protein 2 [Pyrus ussuriensis x Pyrus communis]|uniref:SCY1-like protein 2 n=1 Tax=Pyrus ussuriensis x Pyrus communis TaxID=2448454 RepID=A0A5N5FAD8_9ROSA|nr:SCY1-like protein 2 [Pyrus ussuriensis x Pyrus communis]
MAFLFSSRACTTCTTPGCLNLATSAQMISKNPSSAALVNPAHMRASDRATHMVGSGVSSSVGFGCEFFWASGVERERRFQKPRKGSQIAAAESAD